jgi:predicted NAD/FAD-binding protein
VRIAIVGSGIAGLTAAHRLHPDHDITLFEAGTTSAAMFIPMT